MPSMKKQAPHTETHDGWSSSSTAGTAQALAAAQIEGSRNPGDGLAISFEKSSKCVAHSNWRSPELMYSFVFYLLTPAVSTKPSSVGLGEELGS